ncbi:hypothetical protein OSTOST_15473, partial [Ostertagia ostertagi]
TIPSQADGYSITVTTKVCTLGQCAEGGVAKVMSSGLILAGVGLAAVGFGARYLVRNQALIKKGLEALPGGVVVRHSALRRRKSTSEGLARVVKNVTHNSLVF